MTYCNHFTIKFNKLYFISYVRDCFVRLKYDFHCSSLNYMVIKFETNIFEINVLNAIYQI